MTEETAIAHSRLLVESLLHSTLLVDELGGYQSFDRSLLEIQGEIPCLNFSQKLGHLYEDALQWLFDVSPRVELIKRGVQVYRPLPKGGRETLGEFDYMLRTENEITHVELATKFYLQVENEGEILWPGPDARDSWARKRERLVSHQFGIGQLPESKQVLRQEFFIEDYTTRHLVYGCLFRSFTGSQCQVEGVAEDAHWGIWITREQWQEAMDAIGTTEIYSIPKHLWPCPLSEQMLPHLNKVSKDEMFTLAEHRCAMFTEGKHRYFLVSDRWLSETGLA